MTANRPRASVLVKARVVAEVAMTYARARRGLRTMNLPATLAALRARDTSSRERGLSFDESLWLGGAVVRTLRALPLDDRCLMQALVLSGLLARRGTPSVFVLGVRPGEDFAAHAWVEIDGHALLPPRANEFQRLAEL